MTGSAALTTGIAIGSALVLGAAALGVVGGRRAIHPRPKRRPVVHGVDAQHIRLERTPATAAPGKYRIRYGAQDAFSALVGDIVGLDDQTVTRSLLEAEQGLPDVGDAVLWTGYVYSSPDAVATPWREVQIQAPSGPRSAYLFESPTPTTRWAIHVHGIHSSRTSALRSVPATLSAGLTSLVVSYRGDVEDSKAPPATLGQQEAHDVDAAIQYALDHGAKDVVLVGWSMGATISLILAATSPQRSRIVGLIFIGPALDWRAIIGAAARRSGIPGFLTPLFPAALTVPGLAQAAGLRVPLRAAYFRPSLSGTLAPVLILHSAGDTDAPIEASEDLARAHHSQVTLERFEPVPHGMEWNSDPARFTECARRFLNSLP
jgi:pimeloyl-ACP methyl ester carboxylesterase